MQQKAENTPRLETQRLILRRFSPRDAKALFSLLSDKEVNRFLPLFPLETLSQAQDYLQEHYLAFYEKSIGYRYAVCLKTDDVPVGYVNISQDDSYDLGYALKKECWHKGIATEACTAVVQLLASSGIPYLTATHDVHNPRSGRVMENIGMTYRYSYQELWQPKNTLVTFRLYQRNFHMPSNWTYPKYWDISSVHFVEDKNETGG